MRKSSAPSQSGQASKRPKFCAPFVCGLQKTDNNSSDKTEKNENSNLNEKLKTDLQKENNEKINLHTSFKDDSNNINNENSISNLNTEYSTKINNLGTNLSAKFNNPISTTNTFVLPLKTKENFLTPSQQPHLINKSVQEETEETQLLYFNAIWCKLSKKKHKKWEGDAILSIKRSSITLLDLDGKTQGHTKSYRWNQLKDLKEGETLVIGGKEVEVLSKIADEDFNSGKCFRSSAVASVVTNDRPSLNLHNVASKQFKKPSKPGEVSQKILERPESIFQTKKPPEGALVMPRPSALHQWNNNTNHLPVVDVYVDLFLCRHLRPHQKEGITFLYKCIMGFKDCKDMKGGAILADEMGLGKTLQCLSLIWALYKQGPYGGKSILKKVLVVVPGSLVKNWAKEFKKWITYERMRIFAVSPDNKVQDFIHSEACPVLIISYEMLVRSVEVLKKVRFDLVVCDEGHRLKNSAIKTTQCLNSLDIGRRIVLTGTPVQNDLQELFSLIDFCSPSCLGSSSSFKHVFEDPIIASRQSSATTDQKTLGATRAQELSRVTSQLILRRTQEVNNQYLPPKVDIVLFCGLTSLQLSLYNKLTNSQFLKTCIYNSSSSSSSSFPQHLTCISALRQLCNHPDLLHESCHKAASLTGAQIDDETSLYHGLYSCYPENYTSDGWRGRLAEGGKMAVLATLLASFRNDTQSFQKVVVVSNYTKTLNLIERLCEVEEYPMLRLDGRTPTNKRHAIVERFNNHSFKDFVFLLSTKAGGVGLNLIGACRLVLFDVDWNPANDLQAMARVWRDGQRNCTYIYRLLSTNTIEERMYQRQISKQGLSGVVVDLKSSLPTDQPLFSTDQLKEIFSPALDTSTCLSTTHEMLACNCVSDLKKASGQPRRTFSVGDEDLDLESELDLDDKTSFKLEARPCQLLAPPVKTKKNSCMDELLSWKHLGGPDPDLSVLDPLLPKTGFRNVTFAFSAESNPSEIL